MRNAMTPMRWIYAGCASVAIGGYAVAEWIGWEPESAPAAHVPASVRQSPGGWRTWTFWHSGVRGGK